MARKAVIFLGVVNDGVTVGSGANAVADQFRVNGTGMVLLNQSAQTGAVIASVTSVKKLAGPYVPIVSMPVNIVAGTITFLKIGIDIRDGAEIKVGDVISLVGNVADAGGEGAGIEVEVEVAEVEVEAEPHGSNGGGIGSDGYI